MADVGVVGLGAMGGSFARRLLEQDHRVQGYDVDEEKMHQAEEHGVTPVSLNRISDNDIVLTSLPDDTATRSVLVGPEGLLNQLQPGSLVIELSTILPDTIREADELARQNNIDFIDCPISGGPNEVLEGSLVLLVGAQPDVMEKHRDLLEHLGTVNHVGDPGDAKALKLVNNIMSMGNVLIAAEAFVLGAKAGLDPERMFEVLSTSGGSSHHLKKRFPHALDRNFHPFFSIQNAEKDLRTGLQFAENAGAPMVATSLVHQMYNVANGRELSREDMVAIIKLFEEWAGVKVEGD